MTDNTKAFVLLYLKDFLRDREPGYFELMEYLAQKNVHPNTKNTIARGLGKFFYWARKLTKEEYDLIKSSFRSFQTSFSTKDIGNLDVEKLIEISLGNGNKFLAIRNALIFSLLGSVGMRVSQLSDLDIEDIEVGDHIVLRLNRKKGAIGIDTKHMRLETAVGKYALADMLKDYLKFCPASGPLLTTSDGKRVSVAYLQKIVKRICRHAGVKATSHSFRHLVCTKIADTQGILKAQILLGHRNINTTLKYINVEEMEII